MNKLKKFLNFIILFSIIVFFSGCSGWGWFVPYSLQPSYHEFKKICKLNELPNNEEKYNKILSYFGLSLDTLDYDKLDYDMKNPISIHPIDKVFLTKPNEVKVAELSKNRYYIKAIFSSKNYHDFSRRNIIKAKLVGHWNTRRYDLGTKGMASYELEWQERTIHCGYFEGVTYYEYETQRNN
ncbi:hypothetical protein CQA53_11390 [Helicobacter didelphidarum]|uniref:Lipoprotein n=1 Tax=Helicobacter didelphidarum TaxID=2040648 RepID=A0A3D8I383_9HELI|nr:hypothetical protein [Helicobacter didelphidarum]RDU59577.1 hypothetical protein CQA53_11390 [Helicobacter didelphidarum]